MSSANSKGENGGLPAKFHIRKSIDLLERVREGVDQIEKADVDHGIVIVNLKNLIPHDIIWPAKPEKDSGGMDLWRISVQGWPI